jgi:hypothetical protein
MAAPFCKLRPELRALLSGLKAEMAALRTAVEARSPNPAQSEDTP